jgi:murein DD-endopeptidase MepM/ murein hydrolase activator NlpD
MTKNGKYLTFLFSRRNKSGIFIKRVQVRRGFLQNGSLALLFIIAFSVFSVGIYGALGNSLPDLSSLQAAQIDYSKPDSFDEFSPNSGGPFVDSGDDPDASELENRLRTIQSVSNPASIPNMWAHQGKINNEFGFRRSPFGGRMYEFHAGLDIDGERGDSVVAPATGTVTEAGWKGGYGQMVEIDHGNGLVTRYGHLSRVEVAAGQPITRGQLIGLVGSTGRSTGPHLHFELRIGEKPINPRRFLPQEPTELARLVR